MKRLRNDDDGHVCEMDGFSNVTAVNTFGANGLLSRLTAADGGVFYIYDFQGDVEQRLNLNVNILSTFACEAWGNWQTTGGIDAFGPGAQWGYYTDLDTSLVLCSHRYYDPSVGKWLTRDPLGYDGGINLYAYTANNPVNKTDPTGLTVYFCERPVGPSWCSTHETRHWYLTVSSCSPLGSMGWGPNGIYKNPGDNTGGYPSSTIHCHAIPATPAQEKCLCDNFKAAQAGALMCGYTWNGPKHVKYMTGGVVCQDFVNCLLKKCRLPLDPDTLMSPCGIWH